MTIEKIENGEYVFASNMGHTTIEWGNKWYLVERNHTWSEDDERIALSIEQVMNCASLLNIVPDKIDKIRTWLKSLKDKIQPQPKQEWSKDDEYYRNIIMYCLNGECVGNADKENAVLWLKSLKPQNVWISVDKEVYVKEPILAQKKDKSDPFGGFVVCCDHTLTPNVYERYMILGNIVSQNKWKPSDDQMVALANALSLAKNCGEEGAFDLMTLYEQLKIIKEE